MVLLLDFRIQSTGTVFEHTSCLCCPLDTHGDINDRTVHPVTEKKLHTYLGMGMELDAGDAIVPSMCCNAGCYPIFVQFIF